MWNLSEKGICVKKRFQEIDDVFRSHLYSFREKVIYVVYQKGGFACTSGTPGFVGIVEW